MASCYNSTRFFLLSLIIAALFVPHECYKEGRSSSIIGRKEMMNNIQINGGKININPCKRHRNCPVSGVDCYCCLFGERLCYTSDSLCGLECHR
ncbi:hypothetical protein ACP275_13G154700 [Erythranthe tilingii]